jgi:hypothetical protein
MWPQANLRPRLNSGLSCGNVAVHYGSPDYSTVRTLLVADAKECTRRPAHIGALRQWGKASLLVWGEGGESNQYPKTNYRCLTIGSQAWTGFRERSPYERSSQAFACRALAELRPGYGALQEDIPGLRTGLPPQAAQADPGQKYIHRTAMRLAEVRAAAGCWWV